MKSTTHDTVASSDSLCAASRRGFLKAAGSTVLTLLVVPPWGGQAVAYAASVTGYPRKKVGTIGGISKGQPVAFTYPDKSESHAECMLVKLGAPAGGGIGPEKDIVAFSALCTHMGGLLRTAYKGEHQMAGPCPVHLSTFDLTRHGLVVAGHATQSLPQIVLEAEGDDIYATAVLGLLFGRHANV